MDEKPLLPDQLRDPISLEHYSTRTEQVYCEWLPLAFHCRSNLNLHLTRTTKRNTAQNRPFLTPAPAARKMVSKNRVYFLIPQQDNDTTLKTPEYFQS